MNAVHRGLLDHLQTVLGQPLADLPDGEDDLLRLMFSNYRPSSGDGLRLSDVGYAILRQHFGSYRVAMPPGQTLRSRHLLYFAKRCTLPYYCNRKGFVLFEADLGLLLVLAAGEVDRLMEMAPA